MSLRGLVLVYTAVATGCLLESTLGLGLSLLAVAPATLILLACFVTVWPLPPPTPNGLDVWEEPDQQVDPPAAAALTTKERA